MTCPIPSRAGTELGSIIPIGQQTQWGEVSAIQYKDGERYYFLIDKDNVVSYMPAVAVETPVNLNQESE